MRNIKFVITPTGAPYPAECWWKIVSSNSRIYVASEVMGNRNARRVIANIIAAIKSNKYKIVEKKVAGAPRKR